MFSHLKEWFYYFEIKISSMDELEQKYLTII